MPSPRNSCATPSKPAAVGCFPWLTGSGVLKEEDFEDDKDSLVEYYQNDGYIDFAIQDIKFGLPEAGQNDHPFL